MEIGFHYISGAHDSKIQYILEYLNEHPNNETVEFVVNKKCSTNIYYGVQAQASEDYFIPSAGAIFSKDKVDSKSLFMNRYESDSGSVYSVENQSKKPQPFLSGKNFAFDLIEMVFFHLSRIEEYENDNLNEWELVKEESLLVVKSNLEKIPVVDQLVFVFVNVFTERQNKKSSVSLTHDIDHLRKFSSGISVAKKYAGFLFRGQAKLLPAFRKQVNKYKSSNIDPYDVYEDILSQAALDKTIYFLVGGSSSYDTPSDLSDPIFKKAIRIAKKRRYHIGIHPSYNSWKNSDLILEEKSKLERIIGESITRSRQHYLRFKFPATIQALEKTGIYHDSSLGFNSRIGFRCGTGFPFKLYDLVKDCVSKVVEQPLVYMDSSLKNEGDGNGFKMEDIHRAFQAEVKFNTHICVNFHNSRFEEAEIESIPLLEFYKSWETF